MIIWDIVAEKGAHRLSGHKGPITQVVFMQEQSVLISSSKDTFVKFWDLETGHGFKTLVAHRTEVSNFYRIHTNTRVAAPSASSAKTSAFLGWTVNFFGPSASSAF